MMKLAIDDYATLDSPLHRWPPREKLLGLGALTLAFSAVNSLALLPFMVITTAVLFGLSRLPLSFLLARLKLPGMFLLAMALVLPFFPAVQDSAAIASTTASITTSATAATAAGTTTIVSTVHPDILLQLGPLAIYHSGVMALVLIVGRFLCILTLGLLIFGTAPFLSMVRAMRSLGLPSILADMVLLTYRYLYDISDNFRTLRTAMRLRGFRAHQVNQHQFNTLSSLAGSLLVRSYEQSERVYSAMKLRGYGQAVAQEGGNQATRSRRSRPLVHPLHRLALGVTLLLSLCFVCAEYLI